MVRRDGYDEQLVRKKVLSCFFLTDVLCSYRKYEKIGVMSRCLKCQYYERFKREMDEEEEEFWDEVNMIRKYGYPKRFDVPKRCS